MSRYFSKNEKEKQSHRTNFKEARHKIKSQREDGQKEDNMEIEEDLFPGSADVSKYRLQKYQRGKRINVDGITHGFKKHEIIKTDKNIRYSVRHAARAELLLPEEEGFLEVEDYEDTFRVRQQEIASSVDITSATKIFSLSLTDFGPYTCNYSRDGRHLLLGGQRGHVAAMDWVTKRLLCETNVMESIHDICWLHIPTMFAVAQKNWLHIYDTKGVELHCVKKLNKILKMEFLPYHFLLATSSEKGFLSWLDISIGKLITDTYTSAGRLNIMCQNPYNAVILTGHPNGSISMWSPNVSTPLVRMLCHQHPLRAVAVDPRGLYMATASIDRSLKIWDIRTYKCLQTYKIGGAAGYLNFSQRGLLSVGCGNIVEVYKDCCTQTVEKPYMRHKVPSTIADLQFCPFEDVLGISHSHGFSSILVPGSGEPNFDAFESNPYMTKSQRREMEVKSLLEKIQPELITLDPMKLGSIDVPTLKEKLEKKNALLYVKPQIIDFEPKKKTKGRSKSVNVFKRKQAVLSSKKRELVKEKLLEKKAKVQNDNEKPKTVLDRFKSRGPK